MEFWASTCSISSRRKKNRERPRHQARTLRTEPQHVGRTAPPSSAIKRKVVCNASTNESNRTRCQQPEIALGRICGGMRCIRCAAFRGSGRHSTQPSPRGRRQLAYRVLLRRPRGRLLHSRRSRCGMACVLQYVRKKTRAASINDSSRPTASRFSDTSAAQWYHAARTQVSAVNRRSRLRRALGRTSWSLKRLVRVVLF